MFAGPKLHTVAYSAQSSLPICPDSDVIFRISHAGYALQTSTENLGKKKHGLITTRLCCSRFKRQSLASRAIFWNSASGSANNGIDVDKYRSKLEALLYCGKSIPEEKIEKPTGLPSKALPVGNKPKCTNCEAKGAVECLTCAGSGLYVDAVLESQGVIVRVRCLDFSSALSVDPD
ncbi:hypothetical protein AXG93_1913s1970 [Marchantia polymorpha subsp. ruderalis]|uniref:Uncharacterized protein n=1 Tax=Marchantia polymorpha subsp. ruderalis TaxID=1480154 RepID=A0A176WL44_MARPO|nr:hypothetical protein AXG93_1913s1970 [Marchantia polymorpha subsp. ruderalis]